jgi:shikimate dehydrogenase
VGARCDSLSAVARAAGSVNTLVVEPDGCLHGHSTDGRAVVDAIAAAGGAALLHGPVLVLGAGGSARAAAVALRDAGADVSLHARRSAAAAALADALDVRAVVSLPRPLPALVVNCTPLGGASALTESPVPADAVGDARCVCDLAYRPDGAPTVLVADAAARGLAVVDGLEVLVRQGAESFACWTGREPPLAVLRAAIWG